MAESRRVWTAGGRTPPPPRTSGFRPDQAKVTSAQSRAGRVSQRPVPPLTRPSLPRPPGSLRVGLRLSFGSDLRVLPQPPCPCEGANGPSSSVPPFAEPGTNHLSARLFPIPQSLRGHQGPSRGASVVRAPYFPFISQRRTMDMLVRRQHVLFSTKFKDPSGASRGEPGGCRRDGYRWRDAGGGGEGARGCLPRR